MQSRGCYPGPWGTKNQGGYQGITCIAADNRNAHKGHGEHSAKTVNNRRHTYCSQAGKVPPPAGMQQECNMEGFTIDWFT